MATPEKLDLVIRNSKVRRPLALVVLDEAHNIEDEDRGLRIELLLATIKRDQRDASFLLLTPDVPNSDELASWLAPGAGRSIRVGTTGWVPNDRLVGMYDAAAADGGRRGDWALSFEVLHTPRNTVQLPGTYVVGSTRPIAVPLSGANQSIQTAAMANTFSIRGTSIAIARDIPGSWSMARRIAEAIPDDTETSDEVALVQRFLRTEVSEEFELVQLLAKGVGVHHAGLSDEARGLIEWLAEIGRLRVLCATTTIVQGINFPVSSIFLASRFLPSRGSPEMPVRSFWNLAGRAGRTDQDSVGVVGLAAGEDAAAVRAYVARSSGDLVSRLSTMLGELEAAGRLGDLETRHTARPMGRLP